MALGTHGAGQSAEPTARTPALRCTPAHRRQWTRAVAGRQTHRMCRPRALTPLYMRLAGRRSLNSRTATQWGPGLLSRTARPTPTRGCPGRWCPRSKHTPRVRTLDWATGNPDQRLLSQPNTMRAHAEQDTSSTQQSYGTPHSQNPHCKHGKTAEGGSARTLNKMGAVGQRGQANTGCALAGDAPSERRVATGNGREATRGAADGDHDTEGSTEGEARVRLACRGNAKGVEGRPGSGGGRPGSELHLRTASWYAWPGGRGPRVKEDPQSRHCEPLREYWNLKPASAVQLKAGEGVGRRESSTPNETPSCHCKGAARLT
jgi:hypothetical protein